MYLHLHHIVYEPSISFSFLIYFGLHYLSTFLCDFSHIVSKWGEDKPRRVVESLRTTTNQRRTKGLLAHKKRLDKQVGQIDQKIKKSLKPVWTNTFWVIVNVILIIYLKCVFTVYQNLERIIVERQFGRWWWTQIVNGHARVTRGQHNEQSTCQFHPPL